ncbi:hypothetical protein ACHAXT_005548 [Thalassiosira profunda]
MGAIFSTNKGPPPPSHVVIATDSGEAGVSVLGAVSRERVEGVPTPSSSKPKRSGEPTKTSASNRANKRPGDRRLGIAPVSATSPPSSEKRTPLARIRSLPPAAKASGGTRSLRGRATPRNERGVRKMNAQRQPAKDDRQQTLVGDALESVRQQNRLVPGGDAGYQTRMPLDPVQQPPTASGEASSSSGRKKIRPISLRRSHGKPASSPSAGSLAAAAARSLAADGYAPQPNENEAPDRVAVDPPGAILGALPWMHPANHGQQQQGMPSAEQTAHYGGHFYGGGGPAYQPVYPHGNGWGYQPPPHQHPQPQPQQHAQHQMPGNADPHRSQHQWTMPPFLAPLAASVRHPFATFMGNGAHHEAAWAQNGGAGHQQMMHVVHGAGVDAAGQYAAANATSERDAAPPSNEADEDAMSTESMSGAQDIAEVEATFIPSTFAPPEYVERIRARQAAANAASMENAAPTPSKAAKKKGERRSPRSASKSKGNAKAAVAHQACSPIANLPKGLKVGSAKVAAVDEAIERVDSPQPQVLTVCGKKVTMVDPVRKVFVVDLLSPKQCDQIRMMADDHTREMVKSGNDETWRTLYTYTKMDLPVTEVKDMVRKHTDGIMLSVKKIVGEIFGMKKEAMKLRARSWKEPHLLLYQALDGRDPHTGIEMHYDGCDITWQAMLTRLDEYEGGGTYFRCLRKTIKLRQGQVLVHPGELYHKGDITYGVRVLLVCFTDGMDARVTDDSKAENDDPKYEKTVLVV